MASHESLIPLYAQYSDQQNHVRSHFLNYSKHLTTLLVTMIGASGAILGFDSVPADIRYVVTATLLALASVLAYLARRVAKGWAKYVDDIVSRRSRIELLIAQDVADHEFLALVQSGRTTAAVRSNFYLLFLILSLVAGFGAAASLVCLCFRVPLV